MSPDVNEGATSYPFLLFEPIGKAFEENFHRRERTLSRGSESESDSDSDSDDLHAADDLLELDDNFNLLSSLDPAQCKDQDHYAVLGISSLRFKATHTQIKSAYRKLVLKYHPDKSAHEGINTSSIFACIDAAFEVLGSTKKRRAYDSVDPTFDDSIPKAKHINSDNFFIILDPVFQRNARWSNKRPVLMLGNIDTPYNKVMEFYAFWQKFDSWREYSYLDEEAKESGADREERRYIDKQNKAERAQRKNAENLRIRQLVEIAMLADPRIKRKKQEDKQKKEDEKLARRRAAEERERAKQQALEEDKRLKEEEEAKQKQIAEQEKKNRDAIKKFTKQQRKLLRDTCKAQDYFHIDPVERANFIEDVDFLCERLTGVELEALNSEFNCVGSSEHKQIVSSRINVEREKLYKERQDLEQQSDFSSRSLKNAANSNTEWSSEETQTLIKAVALFPAGTEKRWESITNFINSRVHNDNPVRNAKEIINKTKTLQKISTEGQELRQQVNKNAFQLFDKGKAGNVSADTESVPTQRDNANSWSNKEQKLLEQALKTFPQSTPERWDRIAESIPGRSKKECMLRYKELATLIKAKKAAQDAAKSK